MKRQIKFRGKRVDTGEMVFGDLIHGVGSKHGRMYILPITNIYPKGCNELDGWEVAPDTVGQFTGLLDKNGKEIYEGDILKTPLGFIGKIVFGCKQYVVSHREFGRKVTDLFTCNGWIFERGDGHTESVDDELLHGEVIGSVYDNPELLKGGKE